jgi:tetratricopeptide (TPR) repeat protein
MRKEVFLLLILVFCFGSIFSQDEYPYPSLSPKGKVIQQVGNTQIEIEYERPNTRQRKIFGELVPWNQVWRTGAGHCTKIRFDRPVKIEGHPVPPGKYALLSIPNPSQWIIILNRDTTLYGSYNYDPAKDIARMVVRPQSTSRYYQTLTFDIELIPNNTRVYLSWEHTQIAFDIETTTDQEIEQFITEELFTGKSQKSNLYAGAAEYYLYQGTNWMAGLQLADQALALDPNNGWARDLKIRIYERLKYYKNALREIELALEQEKNNTDGDEREITRLELRRQALKNKMEE